MNIIVPLCGLGERFKKTHTEIKPLIKIFNKEIIFYTLDNLVKHNQLNSKIYLIINDNIDEDRFSQLICNKYKSNSNNIQIINIKQNTKGATETVILGLKKIKEKNLLENNNLLILDGDSFYTFNVFEKINPKNNSIFYFIDKNALPQYSYIDIDVTNYVHTIKEKDKISDFANTGLYYFSNMDEFIFYGNKIIDENITFKNEYYISCVINEMLKDKKVFYGIEIQKKNFISLGTPDLLNHYYKNTFAFLFDLDGTLVNTDNSYVEVWNHLLKQYNIYIDSNFFTQHISGKNDKTVLKKLLNLDDQQISDLSKQKEQLFLEKLDKVEIIFDCVNFIKYLKSLGHMVCIVTNCNRINAEKILEKINLQNDIDHLVIGNECKYSKPHPEPYLKAMQLLDIPNEKCFIFEDSPTGLESAFLARPFKIIGISFNNQKLIHADYVIKKYDMDFLNLLINEVCDEKKNNLETLIKKSLNNAIDVKIKNDKLKGGYISNIYNVKCTFDNKTIMGNQTEKLIIKMENKYSNLSDMANLLNLFDTEYYFYTDINPYIKDVIHVPKFYGIAKDENDNNVGLLLEDISNENFVLNLNLNEQNIDTIFTVVNEISKLHVNFWNQDLTKKFSKLSKNNNKNFNKKKFLMDNKSNFLTKWNFMMTEKVRNLICVVCDKYDIIELRLNTSNTTLIHGDCKSPNIFYKIQENNKYMPYFIDWQYTCEGKGVQDIVFLLIESLSVEKIKLYFELVTNYYFVNINNFVHYEKIDFSYDIQYAICYFPVFVSIWFGTVDINLLDDKNFPFFFIQKCIYVLEHFVDDSFFINL